MRTALASLCALGLLIGCERRTNKETGAEVSSSAADTTTNTATADTAATGITWGPPPPGIPAGARFAVVEGDPTKAEPFTLRLEMPDGYEIRPHHHPMAERVRVIEGTFMRGLGKAWSDDKLETIAVGTEVSVKPLQPHFVRVKGKTLVEVASTGPFEIIYENPADDPRKKPVP